MRVVAMVGMGKTAKGILTSYRGQKAASRALGSRNAVVARREAERAITKTRRRQRIRAVRRAQFLKFGAVMSGMLAGGKLLQGMGTGRKRKARRKN